MTRPSPAGATERRAPGAEGEARSEPEGTGGAPAPVPVLYMIGRLERGGAERTVAALVRTLDRTRFAPRVVVFEKRGDLLAEIEAVARVDELPVRVLWSATGARRAIQLARWLRRERVELIHSFGYGCDVMAAVAGRLAGTPWIVTTRRSTGVGRPSHTRVYRLTNPLVHRVLAVSRASREWSIQNEKLPPEKIHTIPNGVDVAQFTPGSPPSATDGIVRAGTVGNVRPVKGADLLLEAFASAAKAPGQVPMELHFAGRVRGDVRGELERRIAELELDGRVHLAGEQRDVAAFLRSLDIFALPSIREGMSNALLEALATGLPVVATAVGGNLENVREGEGGYLVRDRSVESFGDALTELAADRSLRERMGAFNRRLAETEYALARVIESTEAFYTSLLGERRRSR